MFIVEIRKNDVHWNELTVCQQDATTGKYAAAMAAFVEWVAPKREGLEERIRSRVAVLRAQASEETSGSHRRTPDIAAHLFAGAEYFLDFALEAQAIDDTERGSLRDRIWRALMETADLQATVQAGSDPVDQFFKLLASALRAGEAHITTTTGDQPESRYVDALGWRTDVTSEKLRAQGDRIGWFDGRDIYLDGPASFRAAQKFGGDMERIAISQRALGRRLQDRELLLSVDAERKRLTVRRFFAGGRIDALHLSASHFLELPQPPQSPQNGSDVAGEADFRGAMQGAVGQSECHTESPDHRNGASGANGVIARMTPDGAPRGWDDLGDGKGAI